MDIYAWFQEDEGTQCYVTLLAGPGGSFKDGTTTIIPIQSGTKWGNIKPTNDSVKPDDNHYFIGWYMNDQLIDDDTIISKNSYIFAWFTNKDTTKCDIKFVAMAGGTLSGTSEQSITIGTAWKNITKPSVTVADCYKFENWYINNEVPTDDTVINDTVYCFAYFEKVNIKVTIEKADHCIIEQLPEGTIGRGGFNTARETLDKLVKPEDGYALGGWEDADGNRIFDNYKLEVDKTIKPIIVQEHTNYKLNDNDTATITSRISGRDQENLMIPSYIWKNSKWYKVASIAAPNPGYYENSTTLQTVCIPRTITVLSDRSFKDCFKLNTIYIPNSITRFKYHSLYTTNSRGCLKDFYFLGTKAEYKNIVKENYSLDGVDAKTAICNDGTISINASN